ncbi:MAG: FAD-dependent oxidoreductase [Longimicrobiales bacterium]|nr:FAD-dependent oxidoreductase [Longimicrobiales bacterium]
MDRRTMLHRSAAGLLGLGFAGCASKAPALGVVRPTRRLAPVRASWDRVIRTTVGLRPYRSSGFVVGAERLGGKMLVHNFGHGGAGMSLSWGTGRMAAELALQRPERSAAVVGCGVVGLTTARQLQRMGYQVTIYADAVPPDTTSNMSLASWTPTSGLVDGDARTPAWDAQFRRAATIAYGELQLLVGRGYGVSWLEGYSLRSRPPDSSDGGGRRRGSAEEGSGGQEVPGGQEASVAREEMAARTPLLPPELETESVLLGPGEHPFPTPYVSRRLSMRIEPSIYLDRLVSDVREAGGAIVIRRFESRRGLAALPEPVVFNCTGLGARDLVGDPELTPLKGQLTLLVPQPEVDYSTFGSATPSAGGFVHMSPRSDGIALGGTSVEGDWSLEPDPQARRRIVEAHIDLFSRMG